MTTPSEPAAMKLVREMHERLGAFLNPPDPYAELKAAHRAGKKIQFRADVLCDWEDWSWRVMPSWNAPIEHYRIKPEPEPIAPEPRVVPPAVVPWDCPEDVPLNCWIRLARDPAKAVQFLITCVWQNGVAFNDSLEVRSRSWSKLDTYEYSTDRIHWSPCTKPSSAQQTE